MIEAYRIIKERRSATAFDGEGARLHGGRWNNIGTPMVYASQTLSQAILEILVHAQKVSLVTASYVFCRITFDKRLVETVDPYTLSNGWNSEAVDPHTQFMGDSWVAEARSAVLKVPSVITTGEYNYLLNPRHKDFSKVKIHPALPIQFDKRL